MQTLAQTLSTCNLTLAFTNGPPPSSCTINAPYSFTYQASGNPAPTFTLTSGSLPPGLSLTSAGVLSGTPTQTGTFTGTVTASNGASPNVTQTFSITVSGSNTIQQYAILHNFRDGTTKNDGSVSKGTLVQGTDGNFYGTTYYGGTVNNYGTIFKVTPLGTETLVHGFDDGTVQNDGKYPLAGLITASDGNLYGTTSNGGDSNNGAIFKLTPQGKTSTFYSFYVDHIGTAPATALVQGSDGAFYGTDPSNAPWLYGAIFKLTQQAAASRLHYFGDGTVVNDGSRPPRHWFKVRMETIMGRPEPAALQEMVPCLKSLLKASKLFCTTSGMEVLLLTEVALRRGWCRAGMEIFMAQLAREDRRAWVLFSK